MPNNQSEIKQHLRTLAKLTPKSEEEGVDLRMELYYATDYFQGLHRQLEAIRNEERREVKRNPKRYLGYFDVTSGQVMVSDPCYDNETWCQKQLDNVKSGKWMAVKVSSDEEEWGIRVAELYAYTGDEPDNSQFELVKGADIGVDSGQAGIFDLPTYRNNSVIEHSDFLSAERQEADGEKWYSACCDITLGRQSAGVLKGGAVSSSGYGDGGYSLYTVTDDNDLITAIKIVYIGEESDE